MSAELTLLHVRNRSLGYGRLGVDLAKTLSALGVTVYDSLGREPGGDIDTEVTDGYRIPEKPTNVVSWVSVPSHVRWWWTGQYRSIFTMWEATRLPESFREPLPNFDLVLVPSEQNVELFSAYHHNVQLVELGVDPTRWFYVPRRPPTNRFNFLIGGSGVRKGIDLAFQAFHMVFGKWNREPIPHLILKNPKMEEAYQGSPRVEMIGGKLSDEEEEALYETAHVYLQPSRGEGFGLQPLQAMAQGIPTILTDAHGHKAFSRYGVPIPASYSKAAYFLYGDAGDWWEPDFESLCEAMWDVYRNYAIYQEAAAAVAQFVIPQRFTWNHTAQAFCNAHGDQLSRTYSGPGTPQRPQRYLFRIRTIRDYKADIAGVTYLWRRGKDYWETPDVKRILWEVGVLDEQCLDDNVVGIKEGMDAPSGAREWCPTCGQRLGTQSTQIDFLMERDYVDHG